MQPLCAQMKLFVNKKLLKIENIKDPYTANPNLVFSF